MTVMVALVGEQPLPNFLMIRHFRYKRVLLVYTNEKKPQYRKLKMALQKEPQIVVKEVMSKAHDIHQIAQTIDDELNHWGLDPEEDLVFNLTGGTKAMALAASLVAQWRNAEMCYVASVERKKEIIAYLSAWSDKVLVPLGQETIPACITLTDIFDLHFGVGRWESKGPSKDIGGHFEKLLVDLLNKHKEVDEVLSGISTLNNQIEIDLAVRFGNHFGIIEAKTGEKGREQKGLEQLCKFLSLLGPYSRAFHVITVEGTKRNIAETK